MQSSLLVTELTKSTDLIGPSETPGVPDGEKADSSESRELSRANCAESTQLLKMEVGAMTDLRRWKSAACAVSCMTMFTLMLLFLRKLIYENYG